jgi:hypothetical protein
VFIFGTRRWEELLKRAFYFQDILISTRNPERKFTSSLFTARSRPSEVRLSWMWYWHVVLEPIMTKGLSFLLIFFSLSLVWSELTFFSNDPLLSVYAWLIQKSNLTYSTAQVLTWEIPLLSYHITKQQISWGFFLIGPNFYRSFHY